MDRAHSYYLNRKKVGVEFRTNGNVVNCIVLPSEGKKITDKQLCYLKYLETKNIAVDRGNGDIEKEMSVKAASLVIKEALADPKCIFNITPHMDMIENKLF